MILGYLFPNNEIYSLKFEHKGKFEIGIEEKIILKAKNVEISFAKYSWDNSFSLETGLDEGIGEIIKTNNRLIYKREINPTSSYRFWNFPPIGLIEMWKAKKIKESDIKEYFEVNFDEIIGYYEYNIPFFSIFNGIVLYVKSSKRLNNMKLNDYYTFGFKKLYKIIDDPLILKKELTKTEIKEMKKEEKEYIEYIKNLDLDNI